MKLFERAGNKIRQPGYLISPGRHLIIIPYGTAIEIRVYENTDLQEATFLDIDVIQLAWANSGMVVETKRNDEHFHHRITFVDGWYNWEQWGTQGERSVTLNTEETQRIMGELLVPTEKQDSITVRPPKDYELPGGCRMCETAEPCGEDHSYQWASKAETLPDGRRKDPYGVWLAPYEQHNRIGEGFVWSSGEMIVVHHDYYPEHRRQSPEMRLSVFRDGQYCGRTFWFTYHEILDIEGDMQIEVDNGAKVLLQGATRERLVEGAKEWAAWEKLT